MFVQESAEPTVRCRQEGPRPAPRNVLEMFEEAVSRFTDAVAVVSPSGSLTYAELDRRANRAARTLLAAGGENGAPVVMLADEAPLIIAGMLAALKAGRSFVPLDPRTPDARLAAIIEEVAPIAWLVQAQWLGRLHALTPPGGSPLKVVLLDAANGPVPDGVTADLLPTAASADPPNPAPCWDRDAMCYVFFTSGSTGRPKGIVGRFKAIDHYIRWEIETLGLEPGNRVSQLTSPAFDAILRDIFVPLCSGGTVCAPPKTETFSGQALMDWLEAARIRVLHTVPSVFRLLIDGSVEPRPLNALHDVLLAGERLLPSDVGRWTDRYGDRIRLINLYGPSETTMTKLFHLVRPEDRHRKSVPIGKPMRGARVLILDEHRRARPAGMVGEICIRTPFRSLGYLHRPDLTRQVFIPNPLNGDRDDLIYRTGDFGRFLPDGNLEFLGRKDDQVKIRGVRIELGEIEQVLADDVRVREVAVITREDSRGDPVLVAYFAPGSEIALPRLRALCGARLPEVMIPSIFVPLESLPRTISGKIDRQRLPEPVAPASGEEDLLAPRTLVFQMVAEMWNEVLGLDHAAQEADFFEAGGHSLLVNRLLARVRTSFGIDLKPADFFAQPTLKATAARVEEELSAGRHGTVPPLRPRPDRRPAPLSFGQQRLWVLHQMNPKGSAYNMPSALRLAGDLNVPALEASLREVMRRHEVLRSRFIKEGDEPVQVVEAAGGVPLGRVDLTALAPQDREALARTLASREAKRPFDLERGPMLRTCLFSLDRRQHVLLLTVHHISSDFWSMAILVREILALYRAGIARQPSPLPTLPLQYADYSLWQRDWLRGEALEKLFAYWREQLRGAAPFLDLPTDHPRPAVQTFSGSRHAFSLEPALTASLRKLSRDHRTTLFTTLMAAFQLLLCRSGGISEVSVGVPVAGREWLETEALIGFFVNTLVIRTRMADEPSFEQLLARLHAYLLDAHAHQALPFEKLVEQIQPRRSLRHSPLFQVLFVLQNAPRESLSASGLDIRPFPLGHAGAKFDLSLALVEQGEALRGDLEFNTDLFDTTTIVRLTRHFRTILQNAVADPRQRVGELPWLDRSELAQATVEWNDTATPAFSNLCVHRMIAQQVASRPRAVAVRFEQQCLDYRELDARANQLARYLMAHGVGPEALVGVGLERGPEMLAALLAVFKAGAAYVPLDPAYPRHRLDQMFSDSGLHLLLTQEALLEVWPDHPRVLVLDREHSAIARTSENPVPSVIGPENLAYVIYTSGSTGRPKGVEVRHRALANLLLSMASQLDLGPDDRLLALTSLSFDIAGLELFMPLIRGGQIEIVAREKIWDGPWLAQRLSDPAITVAQATPSGWRLIVSSGWQGSPQLRALCGGEALDPSLARELTTRTGGVWNVYGPTETTIWSMSCRLAGAPTQVSIGRPLANTAVYLLDRKLRPVPVGVVGQLLIGGEGLARGYRNAPSLTADCFVPDPFSGEPGAVLYRTGDLVRQRPDGTIDFIGRWDDQVKVRGFRIELGEIEAALGAHPAVREATVVVRENAIGEAYVAAYFTTRNEVVPASGDLRRFVARRVPDYMVPGRFLHLERLPLTPNGKVDRKALPEPDDTRPEPGAAYVEPRSELERSIAAIWREVLGVEKVGLHDNFFDLNGHSLALVQVHGKLVSLGSRQPTLIELFMYPTIEALVRHLSGGERSPHRVEMRIHERKQGQERFQRRFEKRRRALSKGLD